MLEPAVAPRIVTTENGALAVAAPTRPAFSLEAAERAFSPFSGVSARTIRFSVRRVLAGVRSPHSHTNEKAAAVVRIRGFPVAAPRPRFGQLVERAVEFVYGSHERARARIFLEKEAALAAPAEFVPVVPKAPFRAGFAFRAVRRIARFLKPQIFLP